MAVLLMNQEAEVIDAVEKRLFIDGKWVDAADGGTFDVVDPSTGTTLCAVADATPQDGMAALDAAVAAQPAFAATSPRERADMLSGAFDLLHERIDALAMLMTLEMGKPLAEARGEIAYAAEFLRHFAEEAVRIDGGYQTAPAGGARFLIARQPVGPCLLITPWNFPMAMGTRKLGPAIAAGCTSVIKPAHQTPLSMLALMNILTEVGVPAGVVNCVTAMDAGGVMEPLIRSGRARKLSFTGSTRIGRLLLEQCAEKILRTSLELGGNAPLIVFEDADGRDLEPLMRLRQSVVDVDSGPDGLSIAGDEIAVARIVSRLMALAVAASGPGERLTVGAAAEGEMVALAIDRPRAFAAHPGDASVRARQRGSGGGRLAARRRIRACGWRGGSRSSSAAG